MRYFFAILALSTPAFAASDGDVNFVHYSCTPPGFSSGTINEHIDRTRAPYDLDVNGSTLKLKVGNYEALLAYRQDPTKPVYTVLPCFNHGLKLDPAPDDVATIKFDAAALTFDFVVTSRTPAKDVTETWTCMAEW